MTKPATVESTKKTIIKIFTKYRNKVLEHAANEVLATRAVPEKLNDWWFKERKLLAKRIKNLKNSVLSIKSNEQNKTI